MMQIRNPNHVLAVRDTVRESVNQLMLQNGVSIHAIDAATGIARALDELIREAPDSFTREALAAACIEALTRAGRASVVVPVGTPLAKAGHA